MSVFYTFSLPTSTLAEDSPETTWQVFDYNTDIFWRIDCYGDRSVSSNMWKTVLIVDNDLGFAFWLGQALDRAGYETWPARNVAAADSLLAEVRLVVDLLVINASLPRARAFAAHVGRSRADFKVIAICEGSGGVQTFFEASAVHRSEERRVGKEC